MIEEEGIVRGEDPSLGGDGMQRHVKVAWKQCVGIERLMRLRVGMEQAACWSHFGSCFAARA